MSSLYRVVHFSALFTTANRVMKSQINDVMSLIVTPYYLEEGGEVWSGGSFMVHVTSIPLLYNHIRCTLLQEKGANLAALGTERLSN